jgi:hypothetical protein
LLQKKEAGEGRMSTTEERVTCSEEQQHPPQWLHGPFWERLNRAEAYHQRIQSEHECARRDLDSLQRAGSPELREAWGRYCAVIAELDRTTAELESLRSEAG